MRGVNERHFREATIGQVGSPTAIPGGSAVPQVVVAMSLYQDPDKPRHRPSLVEDLVKLPTKATNQPLENQATATLAWLIDRSPVFAARFVALFVGWEQTPKGTIGARGWVSLRMPDGSTLFPDLSVDGAAGGFQLLIEVKVASELAEYVGQDGHIRTQDEQYRWGWSQLESPADRVRGVGTLTRKPGQCTIDLGSLRAREVGWPEVRDVLLQSIAEGALEPDVVLVGESFLGLIKKRIAIDAPTSAQLAEWLDAHKSLVADIVDRVHSAIPGATLIRASGAAFVGRRVVIPDVLGSPLRLRIYASPAGTAQNLHGEPDALIVGIERDAGGKLEQPAAGSFTEAGFLRERDIAGDTMHRRIWAMEDVKNDAAGTASAILEAVSSTGLVSERRPRQ